MVCNPPSVAIFFLKDFFLKEILAKGKRRYTRKHWRYMFLTLNIPCQKKKKSQRNKGIPQVNRICYNLEVCVFKKDDKLGCLGGLVG